MKKTNQDCEVVRELICLAFYAKNNLNSNNNFLGKYKFGEKEYEVFSSINGSSSIFIKCENQSIFIMIEDIHYSESYNTPLKTAVMLHINRYKNININEISIFDIETIPVEKIISKTKILLNYLYSNCLYYNPNKFCEGELEEKKYIFYEPEKFDKSLTRKKISPKMDDVFEPKIIIDIINQIYFNFKQIYINDKINKIIKSLNQEELNALRNRLQEQRETRLTKNPVAPKEGEQKILTKIYRHQPL